MSRLEAALPAVVTFVFGLGAGLVAGHAVWAGRAAAPEMPRAGAAMPEDAGISQQGPTEEQLRSLLASHVEILASRPGDVGLLRTIGNYHEALGEHDEALARYAQAEDVARASGDKGVLAQVLIDQGVSLAEKGQMDAAFAKLDEARAADPKDVRSRLTAAAILLVRVMPSPPAGWDRKDAVARAESMLDEVDALEPSNPYSREFRAQIDAVRAVLARPRGSAPAPPPAAPAAAPGG